MVVTAVMPAPLWGGGNDVDTGDHVDCVDVNVDVEVEVEDRE